MDLQIHYASDWAALYKDGKLVRVGDSYLAEERALELLGVEIVHNDAFMRGQSRKDGVAQTLDEVDEYILDRLNRHNLAEEKKIEIERLLGQVRELEQQ